MCRILYKTQLKCTKFFSSALVLIIALTNLAVVLQTYLLYDVEHSRSDLKLQNQCENILLSAFILTFYILMPIGLIIVEVSISRILHLFLSTHKS